jgi:hypothetical protein
MLFKEIIADYSQNQIKPINTLCGQNTELLIVKLGGIYKLPLYFNELKNTVARHTAEGLISS